MSEAAEATCCAPYSSLPHMSAAVPCRPACKVGCFGLCLHQACNSTLFLLLLALQILLDREQFGKGTCVAPAPGGIPTKVLLPRQNFSAYPHPFLQ